VSERRSKFRLEDVRVDPDAPALDAGAATEAIERAASDVREARLRGGAVVLCHGAHVIKNGLGPLVRRLVEEGWLTHVATNGAGSIHDWEFAFLGRSTEDVRENVAVGEFGIWEETARWPAIALHAGVIEGLGYGESVARLVASEEVAVPRRAELRAGVTRALEHGGSLEAAAACLDLLAALEEGGIAEGTHPVPHPWKAASVQSACYERGVPFTVHPGIGQDIVYSHPLFRGGAVGRGAMTDFLVYASAIERLEGGVYLSVGSSVMSPMIFEKSLSMARNVLRQRGKRLEDFTIVVNDLTPAAWDWSRGEPPVESPAYYVRFMKTFARMGGALRYVGSDNRLFLHGLYASLRRGGAAPAAGAGAPSGVTP
jgi:hypothetical protein